MKTVLQRVSQASVTIEGTVHAAIENGLLVLVGIEPNDNLEDVDWLAAKIINLRIFADDTNLMNLSVKEINGSVLLISQFTLHAKTRKGNRPSFMDAAKPEIAIPLYEAFIAALEKHLEKSVKTGVFGADMKVSLINDGPVTLVIDSKNKV